MAHQDCRAPATRCYFKKLFALCQDYEWKIGDRTPYVVQIDHVEHRISIEKCRHNYEIVEAVYWAHQWQEHPAGAGAKCEDSRKR